MKPIKQFLFALVALFGLMPSLAFGQPNNPNDPNTDPNWDWRNGDDPNTLYPASVYRMYVEQSLGVIVPVFRNAPWGQSNVWDGILDNRKEDGWVLVQRDFGTPTSLYSPLFLVNPALHTLHSITGIAGFCESSLSFAVLNRISRRVRLLCSLEEMKEPLH